MKKKQFKYALLFRQFEENMSCKRAYTDQDPDYENNLSNDQKRLKVIEKDSKWFYEFV